MVPFSRVIICTFLISLFVLAIIFCGYGLVQLVLHWPWYFAAVPIVFSVVFFFVFIAWLADD